MQGLRLLKEGYTFSFNGVIASVMVAFFPPVVTSFVDDVYPQFHPIAIAVNCFFAGIVIGAMICAAAPIWKKTSENT